MDANLDTSFDNFKYCQTYINENAANASNVSLFDELLRQDDVEDLTTKSQKATDHNDKATSATAGPSGPKPRSILKNCAEVVFGPITKVPKKTANTAVSTKTAAAKKGGKDKEDGHVLIENDNNFILVEKKKKKAKNSVKSVKFVKNPVNFAKRNNARDDTTKKFDLVYITNTTTNLNEGELARYIHEELNVDNHSCHLVVPYNKRRSELKYLNFKVRVPHSKVDILLDPRSWPKGVRPKKWLTGSERNRDSDKQFKENFQMKRRI